MVQVQLYESSKLEIGYTRIKREVSTTYHVPYNFPFKETMNLSMEYAELIMVLYKKLYELPEETRPFFTYFIGEKFGIWIELYPALSTPYEEY